MKLIIYEEIDPFCIIQRLGRYKDRRKQIDLREYKIIYKVLFFNTKSSRPSYTSSFSSSHISQTYTSLFLTLFFISYIIDR